MAQAAAVLVLAVIAAAITACEAREDPARALHERLLVLDSHLDTPAAFDDAGWDIMQRHQPADHRNQVDYPRMVEGGLDGGMWAIFTPPGGRTPADDLAARDHGLTRLLQIHRLLAAHPDQFELALTPEDAPRIAAAGKRVVYISMENASPLVADPSLLSFYYARGLRVLGLVHFRTNTLADSATDEPQWHGLSPAGKTLVAEANRLGLLIDQSHASDEVFDQLLELSAAPIVLTHSSSRATFDHPRNLDDARLRLLAAKGGVIQVNSYPAYVSGREGGPTFDDYMAHVLHILEVVGPDHVGFGADWDGGGGVTGMEDVTALPKITARLLAEGYSEAQIASMWSGNLLRVLGEAQRIGREFQVRQGAGQDPGAEVR